MAKATRPRGRAPATMAAHAGRTARGRFRAPRRPSRRHGADLRRRTALEALEARWVMSGGSIAGTVFHDLDGNGAQDAGEAGIGGATVFLDTNKNGALDGGETSTTTLADGSYEFAGLAAGDYTVAQALPADWLQTAVGSPGVGRAGEAIHSIPPALTPGEPTNGPGGLAWVNGELYQVEGRTGTNNPIWRLDPQTGDVLGSFTPAFELTYLTFDGANLWGINPPGDTIYHFTTDGSLLHTFDAPGKSRQGHRLGWQPSLGGGHFQSDDDDPQAGRERPRRRVAAGRPELRSTVQP